MTLIEPAAYWVARAYGQFEEKTRRFFELIKGIQAPVTEKDLIKFLRWNNLIPESADPKSLPQWPTWNRLKTALLSMHTVGEHTDNLPRLQALRDIPILLVKGADSAGAFWFADSGIVDLLAKSLGQSAKVLILPDGHASHIVAKDQFIAELKRFIASAK